MTNPTIAAAIAINNTAPAAKSFVRLIASLYSGESKSARDVYKRQEMMFNPLIFLYAFLACLALNLLSAGIPAWRASRMRIISALNENVH